MRIVIVGEYFTDVEIREKAFYNSGLWKLFKVKAKAAGLDLKDCHFTNVINAGSPGRGVYGFLGKRDEGAKGLRYIRRGEYLKADYVHHLENLRKEICDVKPNVVIALGDLALWALTEETSLKFARGRITHSSAGFGDVKVLPTHAPHEIVADHTLNPIWFADIRKAIRESAFPEIRRPARRIYVEPSVEDLYSFYHEFITNSTELSIDIETKGHIITCVGVAPSKNECLVVPFFTEANPSGNYWRTEREEIMAWKFVQRLFNLKGKKSFGQNFSYDAQYLLRKMGITLGNWTDDTMLMHHALQPEMQKGLGFLASMYTDELSWKFMAKRRAADRSGKKED